MGTTTLTIILFSLLQSNIAYSEESLIEIPCQEGLVLVQPKIKQLPNNSYGIHFAHVRGSSYAPYILITDRNDSYEAEVLGDSIGNKYVGYILVKSKDIETITFEGCVINWSAYHENR